MKYSPYSFSKLSTHNQCNRKFKYQYIDKLKVEKVDRSALVKGGTIHSILENFPIDSTHSNAWRFQGIVDTFISSNIGKKYFANGLKSTREHKFGFDTNFVESGYHDKVNTVFRGSVDFVSIIDGMLHVVDWKTGKYKEQMWQDYNQLVFYAIYFFKNYPKINKIKISYVYVEHNIENDLILERTYIENYIKDLKTMIDATENDVSFNKKETKLCEWCNFKTHCLGD